MLRRLALRVPDDMGADVPVPAAAALAPAPVAAPPFVAAAETPGDAARAIDCLTAAVYYEARSEPVDGQRAVAQVVLNRVRDRAFPPSVCGVVYQHPAHGPGCQFSFACDGSTDRPREWAAWERARGIAAAALAGDVYAPIGPATYYHAASVLPWWAAGMARIGSVGAHIFYRWSGAMERALAFRQSYRGVEPDAAPLPAPSLAQGGVTVHLGAAVDAGVAVHYGLAVAAAAAAPADNPAPAGHRAAADGDGSVAGVHVHLGTARVAAAVVAEMPDAG